MVNTSNGLGHDNSGPSNANNGNPDLTQIMQAFIAALNANRQTQNHNRRPMTRTQATNEFCERRPPTFHGDTDPVMAETWLKEVKVILRTLGITQDGDCVALATCPVREPFSGQILPDTTKAGQGAGVHKSEAGDDNCHPICG